MISNISTEEILNKNHKQKNNRFSQILKSHSLELKRSEPEILQLNVGKLCNIKCVHCHVNAGPGRKEIISKETIDKILPWFEKSNLNTLDMTGGTPEMIPDFKYLVKSVRNFSRKITIIDRLNATIINEPGYEWVAEFLAENEIEIVSSLPCYSEENVDSQRGIGVFESSIKALKILNKLGYGKSENLILNFVYNPNGAFLPGDQNELKEDYKRELLKNHGIVFNDLYCITNMPIARFAGYLKNNELYDEYMSLLVNSFNPSTVDGLMCKNTINVSWKGEVYDCDFNQMLRMHHYIDDYDSNKQRVSDKIKNRLKVWDIDIESFTKKNILVDDHCLGCTSGSGSSCGGSLV